MVFKGELVYTDGRSFNVARPSAVNGLVRQNTLDYALGLDFSLPAETRLNVQFFQRVFFAHDRDSFSDAVESGGSILLAGKLWRNLEAQTLLIHSLNRSDWMFRPRLSWNLEKNWRWAVGADIFGGNPRVCLAVSIIMIAFIPSCDIRFEIFLGGPTRQIYVAYV